MFATALLACLALAGQAPPVTTVWQIGRPGDGWRELAIPGDYTAYSRTFATDVRFTIGSSSPSKEWPYVHPGPDDAWAGRRPHTFQIRFPLFDAPRDSFRLGVDLANTHYGGPPLIEVAANGGRGIRLQMPRGAGDESLRDPARGKPYAFSLLFPASAFHVGDNEISITTVAGSWMLYDSLTLETGPSLPRSPVVTAIRAESTLFFRREGGTLKQAIRVTADNAGLAGYGTLSLSGSRAATEPVHLEPGRNAVFVLVDPFVRPAPFRIALRLAEGESSVSAIGRPERRWKVFVAPSAHTDIGYTDLQEVTFQRHCRNTLTALKACREDPNFKWNLEVGFQARLFAISYPKEFAELMRRVREGRIGVQGLYLNMLTGLCTGEELIEALGRTQEMARNHGFPVPSANLSDVPSAIGTLPMLLNKSGVRYFAEAVNSQRGPVFRNPDPRIRQSPFWWEGLDGSRVLAILTEQYAQAETLGFTGNTDLVEERLPGFLSRLDRPDYPADAAYVYGAFSDNQLLNPRYSEVAAAWNREWEFPKVIVSRVDEFFRYVESSAGKRLPVFRGDFGSYWEDGAGSSARETAISRRARARLETAERIHALRSLAGAPFPAAAIRAAWDDALFYDEHTWGAWCSISNPKSDQTRRQWEVKREFARRAARRADALYESAVQPHAPKRDTRIWTVINAQSWARDILASAPASGEARVRELTTGRLVPSQRSGGRVVFLASHVAEFGAKTYRVEPARARRSSAPVVLRAGPDPNTWRSNRFDLRFSPVTGALSGLWDRALKREWVDTASGYGINQYVYAAGGKGTSLVNQDYPPADGRGEPRLSSPRSARVELVENGSVRGVLRVECSGPGDTTVVSYVIVTAAGRINLANVVRKPANTDLEGGYFAFPLKMDKPASARTYIELPYGVLTADRDQIGGACRDWYSACSFAAVSDGNVSGCVASPSAPLFTVGDVFRGRWMRKLEKPGGPLFSYAFNNYWDTNYCASQGGDLLFAYSLMLDGHPFDAVLATRFGWSMLAALPDPSSAPSAKWYGVEDAVRGRVNARLLARPRVTGRVIAGRLTIVDSGPMMRLYNPGAAPVKARVRPIPQAGLPVTVSRQPASARPRRGADGSLRLAIPPRSVVSITWSSRPTHLSPASAQSHR